MYLEMIFQYNLCQDDDILKVGRQLPQNVSQSHHLFIINHRKILLGSHPVLRI